MVILDPFWDLNTTLKDHDGNAPHAALIKLPETLKFDQEEVHPLAQHQPSIEQALTCILDETAGHVAALHVTKFLTDFIPELTIPRVEEYA